MQQTKTVNMKFYFFIFKDSKNKTIDSMTIKNQFLDNEYFKQVESIIKQETLQMDISGNNNDSYYMEIDFGEHYLGHDKNRKKITGYKNNILCYTGFHNIFLMGCNQKISIISFNDFEKLIENKFEYNIEPIKLPSIEEFERKKHPLSSITIEDVSDSIISNIKPMYNPLENISKEFKQKQSINTTIYTKSKKFTAKTQLLYNTARACKEINDNAKVKLYVSKFGEFTLGEDGRFFNDSYKIDLNLFHDLLHLIPIMESIVGKNISLLKEIITKYSKVISI